MNQHGMTDMGRLDLDKTTDAQPERDLVDELRAEAANPCTCGPEYTGRGLESPSCDHFGRELYGRAADELAALWEENKDSLELNEVRRELAIVAELERNDLTAKCKQRADMLLIRTRELEDRTAELRQSRERNKEWESAFPEAHQKRRDAEAQRDKAVVALDWLNHLHRGVGKDGRPPYDGEWADAFRNAETETALDKEGGERDGL